MTDKKITLEQINKMKHCIGFRRDMVKRDKYNAYRNYYTTSDNSQGWDELVDLGLATKRAFKNGAGNNPQCYFVTKLGFEFLECLLECKITETE